ncbi:MAG: TetR/AcrR family transcriptional regulator [Nocardioides sp.]|uniref:TetR/AcrR family transcriptional regulator n=1 Tax=Nocardioides sp. TaxID=35761 RepID=UPI0039E35F1E
MAPSESKQFFEYNSEFTLAQRASTASSRVGATERIDVARTRDQGERRQRIIEAATRSALRRGLFQLRIKDVAADLGITDGAVLYYYESLAELRLAVYSRATQIWFDHRKLDDSRSASSSVQLMEHARAGFTTAVPEARLLNEPVSGVSIVPAFRAVAESLFHKEVSRYQVLLERGISSGEFDMRSEVVTAARNLYSLEETYRMHMLANTSITADVGFGLLMSYAELVTGAELVTPA